MPAIKLDLRGRSFTYPIRSRDGSTSTRTVAVLEDTPGDGDIASEAFGGQLSDEEAGSASPSAAGTKASPAPTRPATPAGGPSPLPVAPSPCPRGRPATTSRQRRHPDPAAGTPSTSSGQLRPIALLVVILLTYPLGWALGVLPGWLALVGVLVFAVIIVFGLITAIRSRSHGWVVRLEPAGVTVRDHDRIPWTDLDRVKVTGLQPGWSFLLGRRRYPVVALLPRPGVTLPALHLPGGPGPRDRLGPARKRLYGTRLLLAPHAMSASVDEITAAARDWGHLPFDFAPGVSPR